MTFRYDEAQEKVGFWRRLFSGRPKQRVWALTKLDDTPRYNGEPDEKSCSACAFDAVHTERYHSYHVMKRGYFMKLLEGSELDRRKYDALNDAEADAKLEGLM